MPEADRVHNFSPGPAMLMEPVMRQVEEELRDWRGLGVSVMEISHRSPEFVDLAEAAEADLRELYAVPDEYRVLFLAGGASHQFAMVPLNLWNGQEHADYLHTGHWSWRAFQEARRYGEPRLALSCGDGSFGRIPAMTEWDLDPASAYTYLAMNETLQGLEFPEPPCVHGSSPLVADMTSTFLSRPLDISRFGLLFAAGQKNFAPAGLTVVIVREDLLGRARPQCPLMYNYMSQAEAGSMCNTPPTFSWYVASLTFSWLKKQGGLAKLAAKNRRNASRLYAFIDESGFYSNAIDPEFRSWMNVSFRLAEERLNDSFVEEAAAAGLLGLRGHRQVGGMRASLYNAMPEEGVTALISFMRDFAARRP